MSPRTPRQFEEMREEKRSLIMDVALEHFANEGYHITTINHIAKHAGISKGLMYNYFESKEQLLTEIISRSMNEISGYFDPDKDGYLTEDEFELFVRKLFFILREKLSFWRLFYQLIVQKDVRELFLKSNLGITHTVTGLYSYSGGTFLAVMSKMITDYFHRKKERMPSGYDPVLDQYMFIYTLEGFIMLTTYLDSIDEEYYDKTVVKIIEMYK